MVVVAVARRAGASVVVPPVDCERTELQERQNQLKALKSCISLD